MHGEIRTYQMVGTAMPEGMAIVWEITLKYLGAWGGAK